MDLSVVFNFLKSIALAILVVSLFLLLMDKDMKQKNAQNWYIAIVIEIVLMVFIGFLKFDF